MRGLLCGGAVAGEKFSLIHAEEANFGLAPVQVKRRRGLTVADKAAGPLQDPVGRDFTAEVPGATLVGDITEIKTGAGPLYLATVVDCFSKAVIGWALDVRYPAGLVCAALKMAAMRVDIPVGAIFHSDRGGQPGFK